MKIDIQLIKKTTISALKCWLVFSSVIIGIFLFIGTVTFIIGINNISYDQLLERAFVKYFTGHLAIMHEQVAAWRIHLAVYFLLFVGAFFWRFEKNMS